MMKFLKSNVVGLMFAAFLIGFIWGVLRIEFILLVPYYSFIYFVFDILVYSYAGYRLGRIVGRYHPKQAWLVIVLPLLFYYGDRFVSPRVILSIPFAGNPYEIWSIAIEILIVILAIVFAWRGRLTKGEFPKPIVKRNR